MNDHPIEHAPEPNVDAPAGVSRRTLIAGAASAGLATAATAGYLRLAAAQTDSATPEAAATDDSAATPDASPTASTDDTARFAAMIDATRASLAAVEADRDAVADGLDPTTIDAVLGQAGALLDDAQASGEGGDIEAAIQPAAAARQSIRAARELIVAQLTYAGLPSQEIPASRALAKAHERISKATADEDDIGFYVTTGQGIYETAYDQYGGGAYAQALANAEAILALAGAAAILSAGGGDGLSGPFGGNMSGPGPFGEGGVGRDGRGRESPLDSIVGLEADEPETVPAPDF